MHQLEAIIYLSSQKKLASSTILLKVDTINGEAQETPPTYQFKCDQLMPIGAQVIKEFDINYCIVARRLFLFQYNGITFGSFQFKSTIDFLQQTKDLCNCCQGCKIHDFTINNCGFTLFGCQLTFGNH